jgi:hypothetical protein
MGVRCQTIFGESMTFRLIRKVVDSDCLTTFAFSWVRLHFRAGCFSMVASKTNEMGDIFSFQGSVLRLGVAFRLFPSRATFIYYINTTQSVKGLGKYFGRLVQSVSKSRFEAAQGFLFWRWRLMMRKILAKWCDG